MIKKAIRTMQTCFPSFLELKFKLQRVKRFIMRKPFEEEFAILKAVVLNGNEQFLDIGANRGQSIEAIRLYHAHSKIVGFEPNPMMYAKLSKAVRFDTNIVLHNFGLSDDAGRFELFVPSYNGWLFDGLASFDQNAAQGWLSQETIFNFRPDKLTVNKMVCDVKRWDDLDTRPGFVKIDVQGLEEKVLRGGVKTLAKYRPIIFLETEAVSDSPSILTELGYVPCSFNANKLIVGQMGTQNTLYFTQERLQLLDRTKISVVSIDHAKA